MLARNNVKPSRAELVAFLSAVIRLLKTSVITMMLNAPRGATVDSSAEDDMAELEMAVVAVVMLTLRGAALLLIVYVGTRLASRHERRFSDS